MNSHWPFMLQNPAVITGADRLYLAANASFRHDAYTKKGTKWKREYSPGDYTRPSEATLSRTDLNPRYHSRSTRITMTGKVLAGVPWLVDRRGS